MFSPAALFCSFLTLAASVTAETYYIDVGNPNTTDVFSPNNVDAVRGDVVVFRFLGGNYTATESTFYAPCQPAHDSDNRLNGFNSGPRPTNNGTTPSTLEVFIYAEHENITRWFYDATPGACGWDETAIGGINLREESNETLAGYQRNAARLYGEESFDTTSSRRTGPTSSVIFDGGSGSSAFKTVANQLAVPISMALAALGATIL